MSQIICSAQVLHAAVTNFTGADSTQRKLLARKRRTAAEEEEQQKKKEPEEEERKKPYQHRHQ